MADLLVFPRQGESFEHGSGFSKNLNKPGLPNRKGWIQKEQLSRMPELPVPKRRERSHQSRSPDCEVG